jgi:hypothetical protein
MAVSSWSFADCGTSGASYRKMTSANPIALLAEIDPAVNGSVTTMTPGTLAAPCRLDVIARSAVALVSVEPGGAANTRRAVPPEAAGNLACRRSWAFCD